MGNRAKIRAKSEEFLQQMVKKAQQKDEPAVPQVPETDLQKIEQLAKDLKEKDAAKPRKPLLTK